MSLSRPGPVLAPEPPALRPQEVGRAGELLAADYVTDLGWRVLDRNWRPGSGLRGELDLVALEPTLRSPGPDRPLGSGPPTLVVVEVKTRTTDAAGPPAGAVTRLKVARLRALTAAWLACHEPCAGTVRLDVISIRLRSGLPALLRHHRGVSL